MKWVPLHAHSHYSLLDGLSKPYQMADVCEENGYNACAITDHGSISGAVSFSTAMQKKNIKPILGCEFYISEKSALIKDNENRKLHHLVVLAKNLKGWQQLMSATSKSNDEDMFYYKPRLDLTTLKQFADGNLVAFSGHPGSQLANVCLKELDGYNELKNPSAFIVSDAIEKATEAAYDLQSIFGKGNFFIEIQLMDSDVMPMAKYVADILRQVSVNTGIPCVATPDAHYARREDAFDQRLLLCSSLKLTFPKVQSMMARGEKFPLGGFFRSANFEIPTLERMELYHTEEELRNALVIADMCEDYSILGKPQFPKFPCPDNMSEADYLKHLCREGWQRLLQDRGIVSTEAKRNEYGDRVKMELDVIHNAKLEGYFLIVQDYVRWAKDQNWLVGPGRGSAAGSLVSYLLGITLIDPIPHDLLFSRFYNAGRNTADRVALPDIDMDFPISKRGKVIDYIKSKYGENRVCQMSTFGRLQGRGAIKEVLRIHDVCGYAMMNTITKGIPHEHEIEDQMKASGETSILKWVIENEPEAVGDWCRVDDDGSLVGEYAQYFSQAIRLEGTFKTLGKHAAGIVISAENLNNVCPMIQDKHGDSKVAALEMNDLEAMGHVKFDILGVALLDKLMGVNSLLESGVIE